MLTEFLMTLAEVGPVNMIAALKAIALHDGTAAGISATLTDLPTFPKLS